MKLREVRFRDAVLIPGEGRHDTLVREGRFKGEMYADLASREVVLIANGEEVRAPFDNTVYRAGDFEPEAPVVVPTPLSTGPAGPPAAVTLTVGATNQAAQKPRKGK